MEGFIKRLALLKADKSLSYLELSKTLGVTEQTVKNYFAGRSKMPMDKLTALSEAYKISIGWLLKGENANEANEPAAVYLKAKAGLSHVSNHNAKIRTLIAGALDQFPDGNYDLYEVEGNSMLPSLAQGDRLLCRMTTVDDIIDNRIYVILVNKPELNEYRESGLWVKRLLHRKNNGYITCKSDNKDSAEPFPTFRLNTNEILEIWYPVMKMTFNMSDPNRDIYDKLDELEGRIEMLEDNDQ